MSPALTLRADLDAFHRGCQTLENFDVSATGGIRRRRGFRKVREAAAQDSRLLPFVYSQDVTYLVELTETALRVIDPDSSTHVVLKEFEGKHRYTDLHRVTWLQINSLLLLASPEWPLMALRITSDYDFELSEYSFSQQPWETVDLRDESIVLVPEANSNAYTVKLPAGEELEAGDYLRASYWTERQEASATAEELTEGMGAAEGEETEQVWQVLNADPKAEAVPEVGAESVYAAGMRIAVPGERRLTYWTCVKTEDKWTGSRDFVEGMTSPENYGEDFAEVLDATGFEGIEPIFGLTKSMTFARGAKLVLYSGYWDLWTCVREFAPDDYVEGQTKFEHYPRHFVKGIPVGDTLSCKGTWKFQCSGTWYGSYEVRKSHSAGELTDQWETLAESVSPIGGAANNIVTGDENEECQLRLFLTRTRVYGETPAAGWPTNSCDNALVVPSYKRDMVLRMGDDGKLRCTVQHRHVSVQFETDDWSRAAFNEAYGYPGLVALHEGRLVLAATKHQPQTLWFSQTDDLNNFALAEEDTGALLLTMQTETQSPICWLASHSSALMVGTMDAEWTISAGGAAAFTATSATCRNYGYRGSAPVPALRAENKVLYCERGAGRVLEYGYKEEVQGYVSSDTTVFADHIASDAGGIVEGTLLRKPNYRAVFLLRDGTLALMTYNSMHNVNAWHRYWTDGFIYSVCAMPNGHNEDRLYIAVERDGVYNIEVMDAMSPFEDEGGRDYLSAMETTALCTAETNDRRRLVGGFQAYFATPTPAANVQVSTGEKYRPIAHAGRFTPGWVQLVAASSWEDMPYLGIQVRGNAPCEILAAQV